MRCRLASSGSSGSSGGGAAVVIAPTAPSSPSDGDIWIKDLENGSYEGYVYETSAWQERLVVLNDSGSVDAIVSVRTETAADLATIVLAEGEIAYATDTKEIYVGDGTTSGGTRVDKLAASTNALIVDASGSPTENATAFNATYTAAKALDPNGDVKSATNRVTILVPPGRYDFGSTELVLDTEFIDIIGVSDSLKDQYFLFDVSSDFGVDVSAGDFDMKNLKIHNQNTSGGGVVVIGAKHIGVFENLEISRGGSSNRGLDCSGSGDFLNGTYRKISADVGIKSDDYGEFIDCDISVVVVSPGTVRARLYNCRVEFLAAFATEAELYNCVVYPSSTFGGTVASIIEFAVSCTFELSSATNNNFIGRYYNCVFNGSPAAIVNTGTEFYGCSFVMSGTDTDAITASAGMILAGCTVLATGTGDSVTSSSAVTSTIAGCTLKGAINANVTNDATTPNNAAI